ncbi:MAG: hypothetical protein ACLFSA_09730 [Spirochaetaceae bacterium]
MNTNRAGVFFLTAFFVSASASMLLAAPLSAQSESPRIDMDRVYADRELEFGVRAFHSGEFNRAIQSFEEALAYRQDFSMARRWLAEAYYRSGFVSPALDMWRQIIESGEAESALENKVRTVEYRRSLDEEILDDPEFVAFHSIDSESEGMKVFNRPTSIVPTEDGGFYLVSFGSNEILKFNSNGGLHNRLRGGVEGLNRPFDLAVSEEGELFVSEFNGDRIVRMNSEGRDVSRFGGTGTKDGELLGPQYITDDGKGYIYVTDQGNRRVVKFDYDGNHILSFGRRSSSFEGFQEPTGIFHYRERVYVSDKIRGEIAVFDESGNYIRSYGSDLLNEPEGISFFREGELAVADRSRVYRFIIERERFDLLKEVEGRGVNILKAVRDVNDNLLSVEFDRNTVTWFSDFSRMYSGLHTEIKSVRADEFPRVLVEVEVSRREGPAYIGLMQNNFFVTEGRYPAGNLELLYSVDARRETDVTLMVEHSDLIEGEEEAVSQAVGELIEALDGEGSLKIVSAGENPVILEEGTLSGDGARAAAARGGDYSSGWSFDIGARLSASTLTSTKGRRAIVFLGSGSLPEHAFDEYGLSNVLSYLKNNDITFYCVTIDQHESIDSELTYLCEQTGGKELYLYRSEGIGEILEMERNTPSGRYYLTFESRIDKDFGRRYMPLEVQTSIFGRSGRVESGYYADPEM